MSLNNEFFKIYFSIVKEVDFFTDYTSADSLDNASKKGVNDLNIYNLIIIATPISIIGFLTFLKLFLIISYFLLLSFIKSLIHLVKFSIFTKCGCNCKSLCKGIGNYITNIIKKIYK